MAVARVHRLGEHELGYERFRAALAASYDWPDDILLRR